MDLYIRHVNHKEYLGLSCFVASSSVRRASAGKKHEDSAASEIRLSGKLLFSLLLKADVCLADNNWSGMDA